MRRVVPLVCMLCALLAFPQLVLAEGDDDIPGVPIPSSPVQGYLAHGSDEIDVMSIAMKKSDRFTMTLNGESTLFGTLGIVHAMELTIYGPEAMGIAGTEPLAEEYGFKFPIQLAYNVPASGTYFLAVWTIEDQAYGNYSLSWACKSPTVTPLTSRSRTIAQGRSARVSGFVKYAADSTAIPGKSVVLQKSRSGSGWVRVTGKKTDSTGRFSFTVRPGRTMYYRAISPGTATFMRSVSQRMKVTVR